MNKYKDFENRLEQMSYPENVCSTTIEIIRLTEEYLTTDPSNPKLVKEAQKIINDYFQ